MNKLLLLLLAVGAASTARPEPVDLLDFDQGTVLVSATPSYGSRREQLGTVRPLGRQPQVGMVLCAGPTGTSRVRLRLEQDAEPRTLRIVNTGVQEDGYPGISARTVSLWAAGASGSYDKLGTFEAPKGGEKEFPVSSARPVRRVKVVVDGNWGHAEFTEIMEIDLLGQKVGSMPRSDVSGEYYSSQWSGLRMKQTGARVDGCYDFRNGVFSGEIEGRVARVAWTETEDGGRSKYRGTATFVVAPDRSIVRGIYFRRARKALPEPGTSRRRAAPSSDRAANRPARGWRRSCSMTVVSSCTGFTLTPARTSPDPTQNRRCSGSSKHSKAMRH